MQIIKIKIQKYSFQSLVISYSYNIVYNYHVYCQHCWYLNSFLQYSWSTWDFIYLFVYFCVTCTTQSSNIDKFKMQNYCIFSEEKMLISDAILQRTLFECFITIILEKKIHLTICSSINRFYLYFFYYHNTLCI